MVKKLNNQIAEHCRMYARCRSCILILSADNQDHSRFKLLSPADVAGSTAILNPNLPRSTTISLSWIWQSLARHLISYIRANADDNSNAPDDPATILECAFY